MLRARHEVGDIVLFRDRAAQVVFGDQPQSKRRPPNLNPFAR